MNPTNDNKENQTENFYDDASNWRCDCGVICNPCGSDFRWNGSAWEHNHDYPVGHVPMRDTRNPLDLIRGLLRGIEAWASDEDGVHHDCWEAYKKAKGFAGQFDWRRE